VTPGSTGQSSPLTGIAFKVASVAIFVAMSALIKAAGQLPAGQIVFFRSFFAMLPILVFSPGAGICGRRSAPRGQ
jgi:drug/metabolite transporter (DMT)-like permease